jgi:hypothetical protein
MMVYSSEKEQTINFVNFSFHHSINHFLWPGHSLRVLASEKQGQNIVLTLFYWNSLPPINHSPSLYTWWKREWAFSKNLGCSPTVSLRPSSGHACLGHVVCWFATIYIMTRSHSLTSGARRRRSSTTSSSIFFFLKA